MAWYLFSNKSVSKPMMTYHLFNPQISFQRNCLKMQMSHSRRCTWTYRPLFLCHLGPRAYEFKGSSGKNEKLIWSIDDINSICETCIVSQDLKPENNNMDMINITWYLHVRHRVAVAAYIRLASRSQAKISKQRNFGTTSVFSAQPHLRSACGLPPRSSIDSCWATSSKRPLPCGDGGRIPGHCNSMPYMKILANNQVIFIKHAVAVAAYRFCRLWRWEKMSWIHDLLSDHYRTQCWHPISNAGHIA